MSRTVDYIDPMQNTATSRATSSADTRWRATLLTLVGLELVALYAPTLGWLYERWTMSVWHNAHGIFIFPLVAWLVWSELRRHSHLPVGASAWGFAVLLPALALQALDAGMHTQLLSAASLVVMLPGLSLLFLGVPRTRCIGFPLIFTAFALPIPLGTTEMLHLALRKLTVAIAAPVLSMLGVSVFVDATTLHTVKGPLQVADACSGFSTLYAALAVACLTAYTATSPWRRVIALMLAAPIAIAANVVRVVLLVVLVVWHGQGVLQTALHPMSGLMMFALALPIIFWLGGPTRQRANP